MVLVGSELAGRYSLLEPIGQGGMATVYLAEDREHQRRVVVKILRSELDSVVPTERFRAEIRITAQLQHAHIVPLFDSGSVDGLPYFVMPYVEGETLKQRLHREGPLSVDEALRLTKQIASALEYAHRHGVIHRDVKPENILLHEGDALVADFGIALALGGAGPERLTGTGVSIGTPAYMSPEQCSADRDIDARTDQYSLACVLYEMLTGEPPYTAPTPQAIIGKRMCEPVPHLSASRAVPAAIELAVTRALAKAPLDRFSSISEFVQALDQTPATRGRRRGTIALAGGAVLALGALVYSGAVERRRETSVSPNVLAVAPFDVLARDLALWREASVDYLAPKLDRAGPLEVVPPAAVIRLWSGRADRTSAEALAARTGAGIVIFAAVAPSGRDSVRVSAHVLDVIRREISDVESRDATDHMDRLMDSLSVRILRDLGRSRTIGAVRLAGFGSSSFPAVKAYLHGEQLLRRAEWDSARAAYDQALELDTGFVLARRRLARVVSWQVGTVGGLGNGVPTLLALSDFRYMHSLDTRGRALGEHDSLLVAADSQRAALAEATVADTGLRRRLFVTAAELVRRYPNDAEAWTVLGDVRYHFGGRAGALYCGRCAIGQADVSRRETLDAYVRAIQLDPGFAPPYRYALRLALDLGEVDQARRYALAYLGLKPSVEMSSLLRLFVALLDTSRQSAPRSDAMLDSLSPQVIWESWASFLLLADSAEAAVRLARHIAGDSARTRIWSPRNEAEQRRRPLAGTLAYRGHLREAYRLTGDSRDWFFSPLYAEMAMLGAVPADSVDATLHRWLQAHPFTPNVGLDFALPWWARRGDSLSIRVYIHRATTERFDSTASHFSSQPHLHVSPRYRLAIAGAYLAMARRDTADAFRRFYALRNGPWWLDEPLTLARLLEAHHRDTEALEILRREFPYPNATPSRGLAALERARVAQRLGNRDEAVASYRYVAALWRTADPVLQRYVAEARANLRALNGRD